MALASELRPHMVVSLDGQTWRVVEVNAHAGGAQTKGTVHVRLLNLRTHNETERRFRPGDRVEGAEVQVRVLAFSYRDGDDYVFMDPRTFDQVPVPGALLGPFLPFLTDGLEITFEFLEGDAVGCRFPESVELRIANTGPSIHQAEANVWKEAWLENGLMVKVPLFLQTGEAIRVDVRSRTYMERVHR